MKNKPSDYFSSEITQNKKLVGKVSGTYLGYIDIDGKRYFDHREFIPFSVTKIDFFKNKFFVVAFRL